MDGEVKGPAQGHVAQKRSQEQDPGLQSLRLKPPPFPAHLASSPFSTALLFSSSFFLALIYLSCAVLQRPPMSQRLCVNLKKNPKSHGPAFRALPFLGLSGERWP